MGGVDMPTGMMCDAKTFGAKGDGTTLDTAAIQAAIDACAPTGGTVLLSGGTFLSGTIQLKSNITLWIDKGATLKGSRYLNDYPMLSPPTDNKQLSNCQRALIYTVSADNVAIEGGGTIDGQNAAYDHHDAKEFMRPMAIFTVVSTNVRYKNLRVENPCTWGIVSMEVTGLYVGNLDIKSTDITRDGLDLVDCHQATVENCTIDAGDDGICLKTHSAVGLQDILVRNCTIKSNTNALKFGTPTYGPVNNITFEDITIKRARYAGIALEAIDGSDEKNITFQRITMDSVGSPFFVILGDRGSTPANQPKKIGSIDGVVFKDIKARNATDKWGALISGTIVNGVTYKPKNLSFTNVDITFDGGDALVPGNPPEYVGQYPEANMWGDLPAFGYWFRHVDGVSMMDCTSALSGNDARKWIVLDDVQNFSNASTGSPNPVTTIRVHKNVGANNSISLRGDTAPLDWVNGTPAVWSAGDIWTWTTTALPSGADFQFKSLKNDATWETGANHKASGGETIDYTPNGL
jgi:hypothetical protein